jgi:hypothetical protein
MPEQQLASFPLVVNLSINSCPTSRLERRTLSNAPKKKAEEGTRQLVIIKPQTGERVTFSIGRRRSVNSTSATIVIVVVAGFAPGNCGRASGDRPRAVAIFLSVSAYIRLCQWRVAPSDVCPVTRFTLARVNPGLVDMFCWTLSIPECNGIDPDSFSGGGT